MMHYNHKDAICEACSLAVHGLLVCIALEYTVLQYVTITE